MFYSGALVLQTVVFVELDPNPMTLQQAEDRAHRVGQRSCVHVYYLIGRGEAWGVGGACFTRGAVGALAAGAGESVRGVALQGPRSLFIVYMSVYVQPLFAVRKQVNMCRMSAPASCCQAFQSLC